MVDSSAQSSSVNDEESPSTSKILGNHLINYLFRRRYLYKEAPVPVFIRNISPKELETYEAVNKHLNFKKFISEAVFISSISKAEQETLAFKAWWLELEDEELKRAITEIIVPLIINVFIETLRFQQPRQSAILLKRGLSSLKISCEWKPLIDELLRLQKISDVQKYPHVKQFRHFKYELRMSPESLITLKKFLVSRRLSIIRRIFHFRFDVVLLADELSNYEQRETKHRPFSPDLYEHDAVPAEDKEMEALVNEINNKRLQPTPLAPLLLYTVHRRDSIVCAKVSYDGKLAATGDRSSEVKLWGLGETKLSPNLNPDFFSSIPLGVPTEINAKARADSLTQRQVWSLLGHSDTVYDLAFIADSQSECLISVSFDSTMRVWKLSDYSCAAVYNGHRLPIWKVAVSSIDNYVATASSDKTARLWSLDRTYPLRIMAGHQQDVTCIAFHPNGSYIATGSPDRTIRMWSITDGKMVRVFGPFPDLGAIYTLAFSPNGQILASAGDDAYIWLWDLAGCSPLFRMPGLPGRATALIWSKDGGTISASTHNGIVAVWWVNKPSFYKEDSPHPFKYTTKCQSIVSLEHSPKSTLVAVGLAP